MNITTNNWTSPSHPLFKKIGDYCIILIPIYTPIIMSSPLTDIHKAWTVSLLSAVLATVKLISKCTIDPNYVDTTIKEAVATDPKVS